MSIPSNISKEHFLKAINKIDQEGIPAGGDSRYYDVLFKGQKYPPKLVVSYANIFANGIELDRNSFRGGKDTECFKLLEENGFKIKPKMEKEKQNKSASDKKASIVEQVPFDYKAFHKATIAANLVLNEALIMRFISAFCTKPFVILTGLAGSGKTKLAQAFSEWICEDENQFCIVPVGADWTNRDPLLGYPNALESEQYFKPENKALMLLIEAGKPENAEKSYFLILDEMNLSHVERYFADFLSTMESGGKIPLHSGKGNWDGVPADITLPKNLFIIGTVNVDETTYMFSPKVLDRAHVIEFRVTDEEMQTFLLNPGKADLTTQKGTGANMASNFMERATSKISDTANTQSMNKALLDFFVELKKAGAEFGFRSAPEINRFVKVLPTIADGWQEDMILDAAVMQKLLPKVHGSRRKLESVLKTLAGLCLVKKEDAAKLLNDPDKINYADPNVVRFPLSLEKIVRMHKAALRDGFTSFAEA